MVWRQSRNRREGFGMKQKSGLNWNVRFFLSLAAVVVGAIFLQSPLGRWADLFLYDALFLYKPQQAKVENVVVISIDERSFDELSMQWPWPRTVHGQLVDVLAKEKASVVAFDLLFAEPSTLENDQKFAEAIGRHGNVVLAGNIEELFDQHVGFSDGYQVIEPTPILELVKGPVFTGVVAYSLDTDGFLRRTRAIQRGEPSFAQTIVERFAVINKLPVVRDEREKAINYLGPSRTIQYIPYYQALDPQQYLPPGFFAGKIVLVGFASATDANVGSTVLDHFAVPYSRWSGGLMAGVEIHAHAVKNILDSSFITLVDFDWIIALSCATAFFLGMIFLTIRPIWGTAVFAALFFLAAGFAVVCFVHLYLYVSPIALIFPVTIVYLVSPFAHYLATRKQRNFIRDAFSTYLAPALVNTLIESPDSLKFDGEQREATVMFLDMAGFTAFAENTPPQQLIELINRNLGAFAEVILKHGGMIDKYIGDCIMAVWGVPIADESHQSKSVAAALEAMQLVDVLVRKEKEISGVTFSIRIGLNSGTVIAGNVGGGKQFNYTVLGDQVNLAARLETVNKYYKTKVMLSDATRAALGDTFLVREIDTIRVMGKQTPVTVFELVAAKDSATEQEQSFVSHYEKALELYRKRMFSESRELCIALLAVKPGDGATEIIKQRCEAFLQVPPQDNWDGVYQMDTK